MPRTYVFSVPVGPAHIDRLQQTLQSLAVQPVPVKVALCDASGSNICQAIADQFPNLIAYRRHGPDKGQSDAINEGWAALDGDVYSWLNADDYLTPDALSHVEQCFEETPQADIVYGQSLIFEEDGTFIGLHPAVSPQIDLITRSNIISQPSCFYKKPLLDTLGPVRPELEYTMDWELWIRFFKAGKRFAYTPEVLSSVLWERGTKTSSVNRARMSEIQDLTSLSHGPYIQMKTMVGFYLHYFSEYSPIAPLVSSLIGWGRTKKLRRQSHWLAVDFDRPIFSKKQATDPSFWEVKFYHFSKEPTIKLELKFFEPSTGNITIGAQTHQINAQTSLTVDMTLNAGDIVSIGFSGPHLMPGNLDRLHPVYKPTSPA